MSHNPDTAPNPNPLDATHKIQLYSPTQVACGALLGGPFGLVYFIYTNFNALGNELFKKKTLVFGALFILALLIILPFLPERFPGTPFCVAYVFTARYVAEQYQIKKQGIIDSPQYDFHSNWRVFGLSALCLLGSLALFGTEIFILAHLGFIQ